MINPKLTAVVTALTLFGSAFRLHAAYDISQLKVIEQLIASKDCSALIGYLQANPAITSGSDPLAQELRAFVNGVEGGLVKCLSASQVTSTQSVASHAERIY